MRVRSTFILLVLGFVFPTSVFGYSDGSGGVGGCCGIPTALTDEAYNFLDKIGSLDHEPIIIARETQTLCETYGCVALTEEMAGKLVNYHIEQENQRHLARARFWDKFSDRAIAIAAAVGALLAAFASIYAVRQSRSSSRRLSEVEKREDALEAMFKSVRNGKSS